MLGGKNERGVLKLRCRPPLGSLNVRISLGKARILEASMRGGKNEGGVLKLRCRPPLGSLNVSISLGKARILEASMLWGKNKRAFLKLRCRPPLGRLKCKYFPRKSKDSGGQHAVGKFTKGVF